MSKLITSKHQNEAIKEIFENENGLLNKDRTQLIMACGTGKSIVAVRSTEKNININSLDNSITVLFFPSLYLVNQTYKTFAKNTHINSFKPLVVCSDKNIIDNENDDVFELDASEVDYPVTTNIDEIKKYLGDINIAHKIIFVTYHSSYLVGTSLLELNLIADFGIFDEAHKTAIKNNNKSNSYAIALDDNDFPIKKRLFMTATPKHYSFNVNDDVFEDESDENLVFSMNNESLYGNISFEYSMRDAIEDGVIADYKILAILIDDNYVHKFKNLKKIKKQGKITQSKFIEKEIREAKLKAIEQTMKKFGITKGLAFNSTIDESKRFARFSNSEVCPDLEIVHVDGQTSHKERETIVNKLKDNTDNYIITNSKLFTEGVDLPEVALVAILKNMASKSDIIQTVGRSQRFTRIDGKIVNPDKIGYILLPIFISDMNISEQELKKESELTSLFEIVNSLRENDRQLRTDLLFRKASRKERAEKFNDKLEEIENKAIINLEITHINSIEESLNDDRKNITNDKTNKNNTGHKKFEKELATFIGNVDSIILGLRIATKEDYVDATLDFCKQFGYKELRVKNKYNTLNIGFFRNNQRAKFKSLKTEEEKQAMIKEFKCISPDYLFDTDETFKRNNIEATLDFCKKFRYEKLKSDTNHNTLNIGSFRSSQRVKFKSLKTEEEKQAMIKEFECISPDFLFDSFEAIKIKNIKATIDFCKKFGYEKLKQQMKHNDSNIGDFREKQRTKFKSLKTEEEKQAMIKEFECISPDYLFGSLEAQKRRKIKATLDFCKKFGYEELKSVTNHNDINIGNFRTMQRDKFRSLKTEEEKQAMIKEFECISPDYLLADDDISRRKKIEATLDFCKKYRYEELKKETNYNEINIGNFRTMQRDKFRSLKTETEKQELIKRFMELPLDYLGKEAVSFAKEYNLNIVDGYYKD